MIRTSNIILTFNLKDRVLEEISLFNFVLLVFNFLVMVIIGTSVSLVISAEILKDYRECIFFPKKSVFLTKMNGNFSCLTHTKSHVEFEVVFHSWCMILIYVRNNILFHIFRYQRFWEACKTLDRKNAENMPDQDYVK